MSYNISAGYSLSTNETPPGVKNIWINEASISDVSLTEASGQITAFTIEGDDDEWFKYECALGEGQLAVAKTAGSGGVENVSTLTYRIGGLSQAKIDSLKEITDSSRLAVVVELRDDSLYYISRNGLTAQSSTFDTGVSGAGAAGIGSVVTFTGHDYHDIQEVNLGGMADLNAITT